MQSLCDLRLHPRWHPDFASAAYLRRWALHRVITQFAKHRDQADFLDTPFGAKLDDALEDGSDSWGEQYLGPLEGSEETKARVSYKDDEVVEAQLDSNEICPDTFFALIRAAYRHHVKPEQAEQAARALQRSGYRIARIDSADQLRDIFYGLAYVACVSRTPALAQGLQVLVRKHRYYGQGSVEPFDELRICLAASATHEEESAWSTFIGSWLTEIAHGELTDSEAR